MEQITMITYKLVRCRRGLYYPLFVETDRSMPIGIWLDAQVGELLDSTHVRSPVLGRLALRPGWHSCTVPYPLPTGSGRKGRMDGSCSVGTQSGSSARWRGTSCRFLIVTACILFRMVGINTGLGLVRSSLGLFRTEYVSIVRWKGKRWKRFVLLME